MLKQIFLLVNLTLFLGYNALAQAINMGNLGVVNDACGSTFYDNSGPGVNYSNNQFLTATFCAPAGQVITFSFSDFALEAGFDFLDIYNGPSTASPLLGSFTGNLSPGIISSTLGGCLTFQFSSDGITRRRGWIAAITCGDPPPTNNNGDSCPNATPFCTGTSYSFQNNTNVASLGTINCLVTTQNPVWYYMQIENSGNLDIDIEQYRANGNAIDIDFNLWGPFTSTTDGCTQISNGTAPNVDCSYSSSAFEQANIPNAQTGEFYILLLTNYSNAPGTITFNSTSGSTATTNCDILCQIISLTAIPSNCDASTNTYSVSGQIVLQNPPASGILSISSSCGGTTTFSAPFANQINYTIPGITSDGNSCVVTASFSADATCTITSNYTAPASCSSVSLLCPSYSSTSVSPTTACSNQTYYLEVENTACNGQINFNVVGNYGSIDYDEITWTVTSNLTNGVIASGGPGTNGSNFNTAFGPFDPSIVGTIFTLEVFDSFGDGFNGTGGFVQIQQGSNVITGPITGNFGFLTNSIFGANISVSAATITINTPAGPVIQTVQNCYDFRVPISINNTNYCNTISVNLPWTITCNSTGATLSSGTNNLVVYPTLPVSTNDLVSINWNSTDCEWEVVGNNDCDQSDIGTVFSISPDPSSINGTGCNSSTQVFDVTYIGISGGPNCCTTGGPLIPITVNTPYPHGSYTAANSPFGGINNAAYLSIPANGIGGNANSVTLNIDMSGFCMDPAGPNGGADYSYWVTVFVDGNIVSDFNTVDPGPSTYSQTLTLADIPSGFNSNSIIEIYIYPNIFTSPSGVIFQTYNPTANCASLGNGIWTASSITANLQVDFTEQEPTPATCLYSSSALQSCCIPVSVTNGSGTICSGGSLTSLTTWTNSVEASNPNCLVYSSVLPVAGSILPDNTLPDGINNGSTNIFQNVSAYSYCDADNSSTINAGDTYTLISSFTLTVKPLANSGSNGSVTACSTGGNINLFDYLGGSPFTTGSWSGPSTLSGGHLGTFNPGVNSAGTYSYVVLGSPPCSNSISTVTVTISTISASISYTGAPFCNSISSTQLPVITGTTGGTFSSSPAGLVINSSTGAITPSSSTPNTYTVTYTIPASGSCPLFSTNSSVEIINAPDVNTDLTSYSTCTGPTIATAGTYTINITSTTPGATFTWSGSDGSSGSGTPINYPIANNTCTDQTVTFTITSTANGCSSAPITRVLTLRPKPVATFTVSPDPVCSNSTATVTFTGTACPGSTFNWTWPSGVNVASGSGAGPYTINFSSFGTFSLGLQIVGPVSLGSCTSALFNQDITVVEAPNAGSNATLSVCSNGSAVNLFSALGGTPNTGGTWTGTSTLTGGDLGTFTPGVNAAGTYTYTVNGSAPCSNATATVTVSVTTAPLAYFTYLGAPYCRSIVVPQSPIITGTTGGTFTSSPAGLSIVAGTGVIMPSSSLSGTYTITYTIPASNPCAEYSVTQTVVINETPLTPSLVPSPPCAGQSSTFTAENGIWYEFTLNGTQVQAPSDLNTYTSGILNTNDKICVYSYPLPPFHFEGNITEAEWGNPLATSAGGPTTSGFGAGNNLDAIYLHNSSGYLFGAVASNVVNNSNNRVLVFIDCQSGGYNSLASWTVRTNAPYYSVENLSSNITFDVGFTPEYILAMNQAGGDAFFDLYNMVTNTNIYLGSDLSSTLLGFIGNTGVGDYIKGFEFAIPMISLGNPAGTIRFFTMMVNDPGAVPPTFVSNQFLTHAGSAESNYADGTINFASATPNPLSYTLSEDCKTQTCVTAGNPITPTFTSVAPICSGGSLTALPTTSNNGITGTWAPALNNTTTTVYTFTPDASFCANTTTLTITVNPSITPTFSTISPICSGASLSALPTTSNNSITGTWAPALDNTTTTTYTFTPTAGQCATTTTLTITVNPNVTPTFTAVAPICSGGSLSALPTTSNNSITGTWAPALDNTTTTTYTFTPDAGQCATTATLTITVNPSITPTFSTISPICSGASLSALPTTSNNSITGTWAPALDNTTTTTYTFTPDAGQCATTATLTITVNSNVTPTFTAVAPICSGASLSALPTTSNNSITGTWAPALDNTTTTTYTFTPTAGQCATTTTLTITVNPNVTPTFNPIGPFCQNAIPTSLPSTSTNGITGTWLPAVISTSTVGTSSYVFTPDAGQCATSTSVSVTIATQISPTFIIPSSFCLNEVPPSLTGTSNNGITGTWSPSTISTSTGGTVTYTFTPDAGQCADVFTIDITVNNLTLPTFSSIPPFCSGSTAPTLPSTSNNGITGTWSPATINNTTSGTYTFTPDLGQCASSTTLTTTVNPLPVTTPIYHD